jgi:hypothetical protein
MLARSWLIRLCDKLKIHDSWAIRGFVCINGSDGVLPRECITVRDTVMTIEASVLISSSRREFWAWFLLWCGMVYPSPSTQCSFFPDSDISDPFPSVGKCI